MWIFLNDAFFSVVADRNNPANLMVRARDPVSIPNVFGKDLLVLKDVGSDYRYRVSLPRETVSEAMANKFANIRYDNFKNSVRNNQRQDAYLDVWHDMHKYQTRVESNQPDLF